jgi:hypothetical protein
MGRPHLARIVKWRAMLVRSEVTSFASSIASGMVFESAGDSYLTIFRVIAQISNQENTVYTTK